MMNDRYLFRGKYAGQSRDFIGKWIQGDLLILREKYYIHPQGNATDVSDTDLTKLLIAHPIDPDTIGQCIGLYDDPGDRLIFEGDIIRYIEKISIDQKADEVKGWKYAKVKWCGNEGFPAFILDPPMDEYCDENGLAALIQSDAYFFEVIGNIYDKPELLEKTDGDVKV